MRRACVLAALLSVVAGCSAAPARPAPRPPLPARPPASEPWARFAEILELTPVTPTPIRAQGHLDVPPYALTRVSPAARDAYLALVTDSKLPADALVAMTHQTLGGAQGPTFVMERRAGQWRYLVLDARGVIAREGPADCAGCHAGGVAEGLFGLPHPKEPPATPRE